MNVETAHSKRKIDSLFVTMKIAERCNLNCSYCYYFTDAYPEVYARPPLMSLDVAESTITYLERACDDYEIDELVIAFHGGEPTLLKASVLRKICEGIVSRLTPKVNALVFAVQTNGVHMTKDWIDVVRDFGIHVSVSLDGLPEYNDKYRLDHRGRGSYQRIRSTIEKLNELSQVGTIRPISAIAVLNEEFDHLKIYRHFVEDLDIRSMSFLFPDHSSESFPYTDDMVRAFGVAFCKVFDAWLIRDQGAVQVKQFYDLFRSISQASKAGYSAQKFLDSLTMVIHSDGEVGLSDSFMSAVEWYKEQRLYKVQTSTFAEWLDQPMLQEMSAAYHKLPDACVGCAYRGICGGGMLEHRFQPSTRFDNKSLYCSALKTIYAHVEQTLVDGGYPAAISAPPMSDDVPAPITRPKFIAMKVISDAI